MIKSSKALYVYAVNELIALYGEDEARQLSKILLHHLFDLSLEDILVERDLIIEETELLDFEEKIAQLKSQKPIQYVLGTAHFYGRHFFVNSNVLIPRQETEELVKEILVDNNRQGLQILDIGSGSGCIGITLGLELPGATVSAIDVSEGALEITKKNADKFGLEINCYLNDVLELQELPGRYDIIVSNPPYVTNAEKKGMHRNVLSHEPELALFVPDNDPLIFYKQILSLSKHALKPKGKLYFEINEKYGMDMMRLCESAKYSSVNLIKDLNGKDRFIKCLVD